MGDKSLLKQIAENKLKAFSIGTMGKRQLSKKEQEEQRKREQEEAAAQAFEEFVATFQESPSKSGKVWVKAGTYDAGRRQEDTKEKGKLYKPTSRLAEIVEKTNTQDKAVEFARSLCRDNKPDKPGKKKEKEKKKSNLELFKEELKMIQEEREERHKYKGVVTGMGKFVEDAPAPTTKGESGDPTTTNLYLGNLNPKITEQQLMEVFGKYGPLASIKIMWPRSDEEKARGRNCGFVAFMNRKDGERALKSLNGKEVLQYEMKLGWGKAVPIPPHPIYIPPSMMELTMPPPPSGLPFNAQPDKRDLDKIPPIGTPYPEAGDEDKEVFDKILSRAVVKVVIPTERSLLSLIHRMVEFVVREGPLFEAMIMNREINNPMYRFLFENQSPAHIYYRFKLFSLLQGDLQMRWRTNEFRMFKGGSIWKPPPMNPYTQGMPEELIEPDEKEPKKGTLSVTQRERLEDLLRNISPQRTKVAEAMVFCMEHSEAAEEISECIAESLSLTTTALPKKIARLYLISDILHNCGVKITNASLESKLPQIFIDVHEAYKNIEGRIRAEAFKLRVMQLFRAWEDWAIYPKDYLIRLQNNFLGLSIQFLQGLNDELSLIFNCIRQLHASADDDEDDDEDEEGDGEDAAGSEDLDGMPLDGAALLKGAMNMPQSRHKQESRSRVRDLETDPDLDGIPMDDDLDGEPMNEDHPHDGRSAQAMTTSKWDLLDQSDPHPTNQGNDDDEDSVDGTANDDSMEGEYENREMTEERRAKLREIEMKVMTYQDQLESGQRSLKSSWTLSQQVEHYRRKLLRKV
ncbi:hypothetical protein B566_EDAN017041 [Ephemera danica]|nr:hypothetical protein B566_EDAN017041 [Ephemera danica]